MVQIQAASFSGPLPHPSVLAKYNEVIPNGAERIMVMAEKQSQHRERLETAVIEGGVANQARGSYFSFILSLTAILGGVYLIHDGKSVQGLSTIIGSLTALVGAFIYSKREQKKERIEKATALEASKR